MSDSKEEENVSFSLYSICKNMGMFAKSMENVALNINLQPY